MTGYQDAGFSSGSFKGKGGPQGLGGYCCFRIVKGSRTAHNSVDCRSTINDNS